MPDTVLPMLNNEVAALEQLTNIEETPEIPEALATLEAAPETIAEAPMQPEAPVEEEIEAELIIEDFTIDGICGVY